MASYGMMNRTGPIEVTPAIAAAPSPPPPDYPAGRPGRRRTLAQIDRDAKALKLYCQGKTYKEIAAECGWKNPASASEGVRRAVADRQAAAFGGPEEFAAMIAGLRDDIAEARQIIRTRFYHVTPAGKVVTIYNPATGQDEPALDPGPAQRAMAHILKIKEFMATLQDLRPPARSRVEVVPEDIVDREIQALTRELADAATAAGAGVPREAPRPS